MSKKRERAGDGRYVQLHHYMLKSPAWRALTPPARAVYVEIALRYNGSNNGRLALSVREASDACNINKDTAARAFKELATAGFIEETRHGGLSRKTRIANEWRMTAFHCDLTGALKTSAFLKRGCAFRIPPVPNEGRECPKRGDSLSQTRGQTPAECPKRGDRFADFGSLSVRNEGTHIIYQCSPSPEGHPEGPCPEADPPAAGPNGDGRRDRLRR